jgi:hypothetical protein
MEKEIVPEDNAVLWILGLVVIIILFLAVYFWATGTLFNNSVDVHVNVSAPQNPATPTINQALPKNETPSGLETNADLDVITFKYAAFKLGTYIKLDTNGDGIKEQYNYASTITAGPCLGDYLMTAYDLKINKYAGSQGTSIYICSPTNKGYKRYK